MDKQQLEELIERLEKAEGPSRELDREIWRVACGLASASDNDAPDYTGSIDAALTIKPKDVTKVETEETHDWFWCKFSIDTFPPNARGPVSFEIEAAHKIAQIALCIASLRARLASHE